MTVLGDIGELATCPRDGGQGEIGVVRQAAVVWEGETVVWVGPEADLPHAHAGAERLSARGRLVVPGLVDAHTHLAFGGDRAGEFVERLRGTSYLDLARRGGGILATVRATREAPEDRLLAGARATLGRMASWGVTTVEAKSGYGLTVEDELKTLRVYRRLAQTARQRIVPTCLGAHTVPPEFASDRAGYVRLLTDDLIPRVAAEGLAAFVDVFVEETAFSIAEAERILAAGAAHGLGAKLHADQLSDGGGAALAARAGATSADHLEYVSDDGIEQMAAAGVVAVSLPLATLVLGVEPLPARRLIEAGVPVAVATDFNPGSAPSPSLPLALWLACTRQRMTPAEALKGATAVAARALRQPDVGSLLPGFRADLAVLDAPDVDRWLYSFAPDPALRTVAGGETLWERP